MKRSTFAAALITLPMILLTACGEDYQGSDSSTSASSVSPHILIRSAAGATAADIQTTVDAYRADLGGANNLGAAGTQASGHREINWDGVPAAISSPNDFPGATFKNRGLLIASPGVKLQVSTKNDEAAQAPTLFGNLNINFPKLFGTFSPEKLFAPVHSTTTELTFTVPGSDTKATVSGFGAVFTDVDVAKISKLDYFDAKGGWLHTEWVKNVPHKNKSLSFVGVSFKDGKKIAKVRITSGNVKLAAYAGENAWRDAVAMDDFIYGEPAELNAPQW